MNTREKSEIRELTAAEREEVTGGLVCATGVHLETAKLDVREIRTPVGYFGGIPIY
jgi:hypothetical protein